ncbi:hypothetical protein MC885_005179 [Smutsia gigantea]|nr:hypothetical protein MC885_005179 [Smutsia gigantea]
MGPSGRKPPARRGKTAVEGKVIQAYDFKDEVKKDLSGSEEDVIEGKTAVTDKRGKKRTSEEIVEDSGGEVQNMLERFEADINKSLLAKRKRLEMYGKASFKTSNQKIVHFWKTQQEQSVTYGKSIFSILSMFQQQQKIFQQSRIVQSQRLKAVKELYEQFIKSMDDLQKNHENLLTGAQNEFKKEMALLQKKIMMETHQQEMENVRKSLQSILF